MGPDAGPDLVSAVDGSGDGGASSTADSGPPLDVEVPCDPFSDVGCYVDPTVGGPSIQLSGTGVEGSDCRISRQCVETMFCNYTVETLPGVCLPLCDGSHPCTIGECTIVYQGYGFCE